MMEENYRALAEAIIMQAVKDLRAALKRKQRFPDDGKADKDVKEIKQFFCSQLFQALSDLDGSMLFRKVTEMEGEG